MPNTLTTILLLVWLIVFTLGFNFKKITSYFHYSDNRSYLSGSDTYIKLNKIMEFGEISLFTFETYDKGTMVSLTVKFEDGINKVETNFMSPNMDEVINNAFDWSVTRGYIK